jgi:hypothetical protein
MTTLLINNEKLAVFGENVIRRIDYSHLTDNQKDVIDIFRQIGIRVNDQSLNYTHIGNKCQKVSFILQYMKELCKEIIFKEYFKHPLSEYIAEYMIALLQNRGAWDHKSMSDRSTYYDINPNYVVDEFTHYLLCQYPPFNNNYSEKVDYIKQNTEMKYVFDLPIEYDHDLDNQDPYHLLNVCIDRFIP